MLQRRKNLKKLAIKIEYYKNSYSPGTTGNKL